MVGFVAVLAAAIAASAELPSDHEVAVTHRGTIYRVYVTDPSRISLAWRDDQGKRLGQLRAVQRWLAGRGERARFLMNAGIFELDGTPSGLLVVEGKELRPLNRAAGRGNFYLQPNGVFFIADDAAFVRTTAEYVSPWNGRPPWAVSAKERATSGRDPASPEWAVQSGPMLLRAGRTHPAFRADSTSRLHRNGVGVRRDGQVVFAITDFDHAPWPNLWEFADLFRALGCEDALFLDGDLSQMVVDPAGDIPSGNFFGAIFVGS